MKDLFEAINTRVKEPYWGIFVLSFLAFNWKGLFLLCFASGTAQDRIVFFDSQTTLWSLTICPISTALFIVVITPWLKVLFGLASRLAYEKLNSQGLVSEHKYLAQKNTLEKERAKALADKESELIDQAKRDVDIDKIEDENVKLKLQQEINELRYQRNQILHSKNNINGHKFMQIGPYEKTILAAMSQYSSAKLKRNNKVLTIENLELGFNNKEEYKKYEQALFSLVEQGYIDIIDPEGIYFELNNAGLNLITKLKF